MSFWNFTDKSATGAVELRIDGEITDDANAWFYEMFGEKATMPNAFREELKAYAGRDLTVWIDSQGGSVFAGAGIYNALKNHNGKVVVKVDGRAFSAASVIAMAGNEIHMSPVSVMMIHNPLTWAKGDQRELRKAAELLDEIKESIINAYELKTQRSRTTISEMMDAETWMSAGTAVKEGFADAVMAGEDIATLNRCGFNFSRLAVMNSVKTSFDKINGIVSKSETISKESEPASKTVNSLEMRLKLNHIRRGYYD